MYSKVPYELKELNRWCCFKIMERQGRQTKVPVNANTGELAKSNDESTWADFDTALASSIHYDGIGFFFKEPCPSINNNLFLVVKIITSVLILTMCETIWSVIKIMTQIIISFLNL